MTNTSSWNSYFFLLMTCLRKIFTSWLFTYLQDRTKFDETKLPPIENFYNTLTNEPLSEDDYQRTRNIWVFYDIHNLREYHDHYLKSNVLLLAEVFRNFRENVYQN